MALPYLKVPADQRVAYSEYTMSTSTDTIERIVSCMSFAGDISSRKMFGEFALYLDTKVIAFVCDDRLFMKPVADSEQFLDASHLAPAYPGSKDYYEVPEDRWSDREWLGSFARMTADSLPLPKPKKKPTR